MTKRSGMGGSENAGAKGGADCKPQSRISLSMQACKPPGRQPCSVLRQDSTHHPHTSHIPTTPPTTHHLQFTGMQRCISIIITTRNLPPLASNWLQHQQQHRIKMLPYCKPCAPCWSASNTKVDSDFLFSRTQLEVFRHRSNRHPLPVTSSCRDGPCTGTSPERF